MTNEEIYKLAREYAEVICPAFRYRKEDERNDDIRYETIKTTSVLSWLLRTHCIVPKSKMEEEYHEAKFTCVNVDPCSETFAASLAQMRVLERIFPEIAKEAEE